MPRNPYLIGRTPRRVERLTAEQREKIVKLYLSGLNKSKLSRRFECSTMTINQIIKEANAVRDPSVENYDY